MLGQCLTPESIGDDLKDFFHAEQIATSIRGAVTVRPTKSARIARQRLVDARFDQAPVMSDRRPVGWVAADELRGRRTISSAMTSLNDCALVSAESSIANVLKLLPGSRFLFVVGKQGLSGFIVRSDLDRHAVRSYLYLLIAGIEMLLAEIVNRQSRMIGSSLHCAQARRGDSSKLCSKPRDQPSRVPLHRRSGRPIHTDTLCK